MGANQDIHNPGFVRNYTLPAGGGLAPIGANPGTFPGLQTTGGYSFAAQQLGCMMNVSMTFDVATGSTAVGTLGIQVSDFGDNERPGYDSYIYATTFPWAPLLQPNGSTTAITVPLVTGAQTINLQLPLLASQWIRVVYTPTSGTGTINVALTGRAVSRT